MKIFENSVFVNYIERMRKIYSALEEKAKGIYSNSFTHRLIRGSRGLIKSGLKYSLFGRLTELNSEAHADYFRTSRIVKMALSWRWPADAKARMSKVSLNSGFYVYAAGLKQDFLSSPLKTAAVILIAAIMTNAVLMLMWQRQITLWGWMIRGLFLFLGVSGLGCNADWDEIKDTGLIIRVVRRARGKGLSN